MDLLLQELAPARVDTTGKGDAEGSSNKQGKGDTEGFDVVEGYGATEGNGDNEGSGDREGYGDTEGHAGYGDTVGYSDTESYGDAQGSGDTEDYGVTVGYGDTEGDGDTQGYGDTVGYGGAEGNGRTQGNGDTEGYDVTAGVQQTSSFTAVVGLAAVAGKEGLAEGAPGAGDEDADDEVTSSDGQPLDADTAGTTGEEVSRSGLAGLSAIAESDRVDTDAFLEMVQAARQNVPHVQASPEPLLAIADGPWRSGTPAMSFEGAAVPLEAFLDSTSSRYIQAFEPYDVSGNHICRPHRAMVIVGQLCEDLGRRFYQHQPALHRLVRQAVSEGYFRFSNSFALFEYFLECLAPEAPSDMSDSDSDMSTLS